jgi:hypothetical protein
MVTSKAEYRVEATFVLGPDFIQRTRELEGIVGAKCGGSGAGVDGERDVSWYFKPEQLEVAVAAYNSLSKVGWLKGVEWEVVEP